VDYLMLAMALIAWCGLHSGLISLTLTRLARERLGQRYRYYRLFYNLLSVLTFLPLMVWAHLIGGDAMVVWQGPWRLLQMALLAAAFWLFWAGARRYDMAQVVGLRQLSDDSDTVCSTIGADCEIDRQGILGWMRHPWYTAAFMLIWARDLNIAAILVNIILSAYLYFGTVLEERKLIAQFGDTYTRYMQEVSAFIPLKSLWRRFQKGI
jgi:protein-S-isoprenylcysteine O-methyltransferase Ste14